MDIENNPTKLTESADLANSAVSMTIILNECINYASWQNSVLFLRSLVIRNDSHKPLHNLQLEMRIKPAFAQTRKWVIERIDPGTELAITDLRIELDAGYLNRLNEAERGRVKLELRFDKRIIATLANEIRILARDEWGGLGTMSALLTAFVMPNDPAIAKIMKSAGEALAAENHSSALDGYQSGDPRRAYMLNGAIWSAIAAESLTYANPPRSFESAGQKIRRLSTILSEGLATCLDSSLIHSEFRPDQKESSYFKTVYTILQQ